MREQPVRARSVRRPSALLAALAVPVLVGVVLPAGPAVAGPAAVPGAGSVVCDGRLVRQRIDADVRVPAGRQCHLDRVAVTGDVVAEADASISTTSTTIMGDLHLAARSIGNPYDSTIWGGVVAEQGVHLSAGRSTVVRSVRGDFSFLQIGSSRVQGAVNVVVPSSFSDLTFDVVNSRVDGWVNVHGGSIRLENSVLGSGLTASAPSMMRMCDAQIAQDVTVRWSHGPVGIGATVLREDACLTYTGRYKDTLNVIGGSVHLVDNPHSIVLRHTTIAGDLLCTGSTGPRGIDATGPTVVVAGSRSGQCVP